MKKSKRTKKESFFEKEAAVQRAVEAADAEIAGEKPVKDEPEVNAVEAKDEVLIDEMEEREEEEVSKGLHDTHVVSFEGTSKKRFYKSRMFQIGAFIVILLLIVGIIFAFQNGLVNPKFSVGTNSSGDEVSKLIDKIGSKMLLPENDIPTVATVTDKSKLSNEPFFARAEDGDKVLIFATSKQAILYRPSIDRIVAVSPVNPSVFDQTQKADQATASSNLVATPTAPQKLKVVVLNSTQTPGLAKKAGDLLDEELYDVISTSNAQGDYDTTVISSALRGKIPNSELEKIATNFDEIDPELSALPSDEAAPAGADVVIIIGSDFDEAY